ncbi:MAG: 7-cyano-7-deazaguanine synthase [Candidatus Omnitrophica bacterium]|nr:7-cyano-7-deazaguanine synthase [Candidatus Omnitrophota bacterium]
MNEPYIYKGKGQRIDTRAAWEYIRKGYLLKPRTVLEGRTKHLQSSLALIKVVDNNLLSITEKALKKAMGKMAGAKRLIMFSGGFDSLLMAHLARQAGAKVEAVTLQFEDFNLYTVKGACESAQKTGIPHQILHVTAVEFLSAFEHMLGVIDEPVLDLALGVVDAAFKKHATQIGQETFISGMGADQWFGNAAFDDRFSSLEQALDWARVNQVSHQRIAKEHGCQFVFPFLSNEMLALAQQVPWAMKKDKKLLRALACSHQIPHRGLKTEVQLPILMERILIKKFAHRAWPKPVSPKAGTEADRPIKLRQIILGLWLEKHA